MSCIFVFPGSIDVLYWQITLSPHFAHPSFLPVEYWYKETDIMMSPLAVINGKLGA